MSLETVIEVAELEVQANNDLITVDELKSILRHIKENMADNEMLTKILVSDDCTGFTSFGDKLAYDLVLLLSKIFNDQGEWFSWWLWEDGNKFVWFGGLKYDLNDIDDFCHFVRKEYNLIKSEVDNG